MCENNSEPKTNEDVLSDSAPKENDAPQDTMEQQAEAEKVADQLEQESLNELQALREENNEQNEELVDEAEKKIREIYADFRKWVKINTEPERVKENLENAKDQTIEVLKATRAKAIEISESDDFRKAAGGIKDFLDGSAALIGEGLQYGKDQLKKNPFMKDVIDNVDNGIEKIRENEAIATVVDKAQELTENVTSAVFNGLKGFFEGKKAKKEESAAAPEAPAAPSAQETETTDNKGE